MTSDFQISLHWDDVSLEIRTKLSAFYESSVLFGLSKRPVSNPMKNKSATEFFDSNGPLRGAKRDLYEGGIRIPLIAYWPSVVPAGRVSNHISAAWDFMPTFCDMAGIEKPDGIDGLSFLPELKGKEQSSHEILYWEYHTKGGNQAVRMGDWKAVRMDGGSDPAAPVELYNLANDIGEKRDVASENPEIVKRAIEIMDTEHSPSELFPFGDEKN